MLLYNSLTKKKEEFVPIVPGEIKMYSCGPTVYNYFHIGNARPFIVFDTLRRYLEYTGNKVIFVQNFTDIDDKMINKANELGITVKELGEKFIGEYFKDADALNIERASFHPRATEHIGEIINLIERLIASGHAYESNGDVYFSTRSFKEYGKLSGQPLENLELGARIDPGEAKREPMDFALWKAMKPGEPAWDSPWGKGRPGWHIECSAMSMKYLGDTFDIHSGGKDLIFPHHENEIAQSEAVTGKPFARYWLHNGYINVDNRKMSKSLGNFFTVREISADFSLDAVRLFMLSSHYRNPINFSRELIEQAAAGLERIRTAYTRIEDLLKNAASGSAPDTEFTESVVKLKSDFMRAMDDDLNTADAISVLFELTRFCNTFLDENSSKETLKAAQTMFDELTGVLGLTIKKIEADFGPEIYELAEKRQMARAQKNFALADSIRKELEEKGILIEDTPKGPKLKKR